MEDYAAAVTLGSLAGCEFSQEEREFFRTYAPAGITLFARNIDQKQHDRLQQLTSQLQSLRSPASPPYLIAIDQEGGRVARLKGSFPNEGPAMYLADGSSSPTALRHIESYAYRIGESLRAYGVNVNFAPVMDILSRPENIAIGDRAFGDSPEAVSCRSGAFLKGLLASQIIPCIKHFPGQGAASVDTHEGSAIIPLSAEALTARELLPFQRWLPLSPMVMMAHCIYPAWDHKEASRSAAIMQGLLRDQLGFGGLIVTDDMTMGAVTKLSSPWQDIIVETISNGADLLLICQGLDLWQEAIETLRQEAHKSPAFYKRLQQAHQRVNKLRMRLTPQPAYS